MIVIIMIIINIIKLVGSNLDNYLRVGLQFGDFLIIIISVIKV